MVLVPGVGLLERLGRLARDEDAEVRAGTLDPQDAHALYCQRTVGGSPEELLGMVLVRMEELGHAKAVDRTNDIREGHLEGHDLVIEGVIKIEEDNVHTHSFLEKVTGIFSSIFLSWKRYLSPFPVTFSSHLPESHIRLDYHLVSRTREETSMGVPHGREVDPQVIHDPTYHGCERKRRYETRVEAQKAANLARRRKDAPAIYVYRCQFCGGWHLTHRKPR